MPIRLTPGSFISQNCLYFCCYSSFKPDSWYLVSGVSSCDVSASTSQAALRNCQHLVIEDSWRGQPAFPFRKQLSCHIPFQPALTTKVLSNPVILGFANILVNWTMLFFPSPGNRRGQTTKAIGSSLKTLDHFALVDTELKAVFAKLHPDFCGGPGTQQSCRLAEQKGTGGRSSHLS